MVKLGFAKPETNEKHVFISVFQQEINVSANSVIGSIILIIAIIYFRAVVNGNFLAPTSVIGR
jgi:hypothetical protein